MERLKPTKLYNSLNMSSSFFLLFVIVHLQTVLLDESRFITLMQRVKWLSLVTSTLLVTYNTVGAALAGISGLKEKLKDQMAAIMAGVPER